jgi:putative flippase GtrA
MYDWFAARLRPVSHHVEKVLRYCGVSAVNVITGQSTLLFALAVLDLKAVPAQALAATVSAGPSYVLSRRWVWRQTGRDSIRNEILPFWLLTGIGLAIALTAVALVDQVTDSPPVLMLTSLVAYGFVWVAKYLVLDLVTWRDDDPASGDDSSALTHRESMS